MSRGPEIISLAAKRGIHLSLAGDRIRWRADNGMDTTVARAIREFRADVVAELELRAAAEQREFDEYKQREEKAQSAARTRIANGTAYPRDVHLAAGLSIGEADARTALSQQGA